MFQSPRAAIILVFSAFGACIGTHLGAIPVIFKNAALTDIFFGQAQSIIMFCSLGAMVFGGMLGRVLDHRTVMLVLLPALTAALAYALIVQSQMAYLVSCIIFAGLLSMLDIHMNAEGAMVEEELGRPVYSSFHAGVSLAMAGMAIVSSFLSVKLGPLAPGVLATLVCALAFFKVWTILKPRPPVAHSEGHDFRSMPFGKLLLAGTVIGSSGLVEMLSVLYAGQLLAKLAPALAEYSGLGVAFYAGCMGTVRAFGDRLRARFGDRLCLAVSLSVATLGCLVLSTGPGFALSVLAYAAVGAGQAFVGPIIFPIAGRFAPQQRSSAIALAFGVASVFRFVAPVFVGGMVAVHGINSVFAVCTVLALAAIVLAQIVLRLGTNEKGAAEAAPDTLNSQNA